MDQLTDTEIAELARRLTNILDEPEPGLSTWHAARARLGRELHDALTAALGEREAQAGELTEAERRWRAAAAQSPTAVWDRLLLAEYDERGRKIAKLRNELATDVRDDARDYRLLADQVIKWFNPPDMDEAEVAIHMDAVMRAGKFIEAQPCTCEDGAAEYLVEACPRCVALGRAADRPEER